MPTPHKYVAKGGRVTYRVRFRHDDHGCSETFNTEKQAIAFCSDINTRNTRYALRVLHDVEREATTTIDAIAEAFFTWKATRVRSDRTVADYRRDYKNWIRPTFGARAAGSVDESDVQALSLIHI